jgi:hypothetical protein
MTDDEVEKFRASERERMAPMRDAMRKEAFVQGYLRGSLSTKAIELVENDELEILSSAHDAEILALLPIADAAYATYRKDRT